MRMMTACRARKANTRGAAETTRKDQAMKNLAWIRWTAFCLAITVCRGMLRAEDAVEELTGNPYQASAALDAAGL
ncbi:MAG: hypothetical protein N2C14_33065, partial [Planctomycetales bacterium]